MLTTLVPTALRLCTRWLAMVACFGPRRRCRPAQTFALKKPPGLSGAHCHGGTHRHLLSLAWPEQASAGANGRRAECSGQRTHGRWGSRACGQDMPRCRRGQRFPGRGRHDPIRIFLLSGGGGDRLAWWFVCRCRHLDFRFLPNAALVVIADQVPCITSPVFALLAGQQVAVARRLPAFRVGRHRAGPGLFARDCCRSGGAQASGPLRSIWALSACCAGPLLSIATVRAAKAPVDSPCDWPLGRLAARRRSLRPTTDNASYAALGSRDRFMVGMSLSTHQGFEISALMQQQMATDTAKCHTSWRLVARPGQTLELAAEPRLHAGVLRPQPPARS